MSAVDVLAVMEDAEQKLRLAGCSYEQTIPLREARAAVAKLVDKVDSALELGWSDTAARELRAARAGSAA